MSSSSSIDKVVIIGGGIVGMSAAYRLTCHGGVQVVLVDRDDKGKATAAAAGILSPGNRFVPKDPILPLLTDSKQDLTLVRSLPI